MTYKEINGIKISSVCMGCWNIAGDRTWGPQDERDSIGAIKASLAAGVNFFDTAEAYGGGYSEELLGRVLGPVRGEAVIATKTSRLEPEKIKKACEGSLKRLNTDYIDIYYLHWPDPAVPAEESAEAMLELAKQGKIRMPAVSNYGAADLKDILGHMPVKIDQMAYNLLFRAVEHEILPYCVSNGIAVAAYSPIAEGLLSGKFVSAEGVPAGRARTRHFSGARPEARHGELGFEADAFRAVEKIRKIASDLSVSMAELAIAWLLHRGGVGFAVAGSRNAGQAESNAKAAGLSLPAGVAGELDKITCELKNKMGANPDMWEHESRIK